MKLAFDALEHASMKENFSDFMNQLIQKALELWEFRDFDSAIEKCNEFIEWNSEIQFVHLFKAMIHSSAKEFYKSQDIVDSIDKEDLENYELKISLFISAINQFYTNKYQKSLDLCNEFLKRNNEEFTEIHIIRGLANASLEKHKDAIKDFKIALKDTDQENAIKANLAYSYLRNKNHLKALLLFRKISKVYPNQWKVQYNTGLSYFKFAQFRKAMPFLNKTEELKADFAGTYLTRGFIYLKKGKKELAHKDFLKAKELGAERNYEIIMRKYYHKY
ncbi:tetratricopeptide repeat protein [Gaetbulibacter sp. PBL-D1]|uniref:tetratricopeptide repeat protein n=1 Tax=Gaetbulibacter sp. PBL-D1 TaxID=3422594 RepID=UPI003D2F2183